MCRRNCKPVMLRAATAAAVAVMTVVSARSGSARVAASAQAPESPTLAALAADLQRQHQRALDAFWPDLERQGTPLVEEISNDPLHVLVTFVWRTQGPTPKNVVIVGGPAPPTNIADNQLARMGNTDLWYRTYRVGRDARFTYRFSINDDLLPPNRSPDWPKKAEGFVRDPLNPHTYPTRGGRYLSVVEAPAALPQPYVKERPGVPAGRVEEKTFEGSTLGNERRIWVYTPPGYRPGQSDPAVPYWLLVVFDGSLYTSRVPGPTILDNLVADGRIPPFVAVFVSNVEDGRQRDLGGSAPFADFLATELLAWVRTHYRVTTDPSRSVLAGSSLGGLMAAYTALRHPDAFGNVLSQSGSYWWWPGVFDSTEGDPPRARDPEPEWVARQVASWAKRPVRFYMDVGLFENFPTRNGGPSMLAVNRHFRDVLRARGYTVFYQEFDGAHEYLNWQGTLADGLIALVGSPGGW